MLFKRRAATRQRCPTCKGTGKVPFECQCCMKPLPYEDALCAYCLENMQEPCYEAKFAGVRFSAAQLAQYDAWRKSHTPACAHAPKYFEYRDGYPLP